MLALRTTSRRRLALRLRDALGLNALDRTKLRVGRETITSLFELLEQVMKSARLSAVARKLKLRIVEVIIDMAEIMVTEVPVRNPRAKLPAMTFAQMEANLLREGINCSTFFRFQSFDHLRQLTSGFGFPQGLIKVGKGYRTCAEEVVLISLSRLSFPSRWDDLKLRFPGNSAWFMQACFYYFLDFQISNWGCYLILNNLAWWKPRLPASCEAIRMKLQQLNHVDWRQFHPPADQPNGFRVCAFIDNTLIAMCRPGGVMEDGPAAPRVPFEVQQAWYPRLPPFLPSFLF